MVTMGVVQLQLQPVCPILSPPLHTVTLPSLLSSTELTDRLLLLEESFLSEVKIGNNTIKLPSYGQWLPNGHRYCHLIRLTYSHIKHKYLTSAHI